MEKGYIHPTASIRDSQIGDVKIFRDVVINDSVLKDGCSIGDDTVIERCNLDHNIVINRRSYINDSQIGKYTYAGINTTVNYAKIGKFCSIARNVDIGGFDHDYKKVTTMPPFRWNQICQGGGKLKGETGYQEWCEIGNDVWIAAGSQILHKVNIGDGAVVGGGAVVTHDVPPYAIVAGVPAKIIGYRCREEDIKELLKIKWWDWPESVIRDNMEYLMENDIGKETLECLKDIQKKIFK